MASTDKLSCLQDEEGMPTHPPVLIQSISIQAFKAFKSKLKIGPLAPFTCIVGPNGTGKSVIGEALAFAFGASPAAMRAKSSSSIVNQDFSRQHAKASAKVSVKLERTMTCEKVTVRRVISEKSSKFYWKDENKKREISLTELKEKLATLSIPADNLDRFLVMQNRVSVKVKHPLELVKYLELVIGTSHYEEKIKELDEEIEKQSTEFESIQESLSEIQLKRQQLNPEVEKWKMFTEKWYEFSRRKASFLRKQGKTLQGRLQICREQKRDKSSKLAQIEEKRNSVQESLTKLNVECTQLQALLQDCRKKHKITEKQYNSLRIKMIKEEVQLKEAEKEVVQQKSLHQKEQDSLEKRRTDAQNEIDFLSVDVSKLESKKEQLCKEKEEAEEKRSYILSQASSSETSGLQVEDILDQEESLLNMKITRLQNLVDISNERRTKQASRVSQLVHEIEVSKKELGERLKFEEEEERKVSAIKYRLNQLHEETCLISEQKITRLKEEITKNEVSIKNELSELMASETTTEDQLSKVLLALQDSCDPRQDKKVHRESNDLSSLQELANEAEDEEGMVLAQEEMSLNEIRRSIHADALEEDVKYKKDESYLLTQSEVFSQMIESKRSQKDKLENDRFHTFREAIKKVNGMLSKIYQNLTKRGDAYLSLTEDKSLLFSEGVNLHVRPDRHKWRNFSSLSGGQQALASLALSFSLQAVFPSPFYFFDEIDAALDTKNARLVAEYMKKQTSAQYIVVSHRPQVYEYATSLVGVYHYNDASTCVIVSV